MPNHWTDRNRGAGFLTRLIRDRRGNTLAIAAASVVPLAGMVGGGLDISRLYIAKTRLQHACDAGVLAGRKAMGAGMWNQNNYAPRTTALQFFDGNFQDGAYGSNTLTKTFTENAGKVSGNASVRMPMTLMKIFGKPTTTLSVSCDAEMRLPNTDVMFVLDTTGSMADPQPGDTVSKIAALRTAVKCFYEIVARIDTNATCTTGVPSGGTGNQVQIRFGFVPYSTNVNVGRLLPTGWFADSWTYQTRRARWWSTRNVSQPVKEAFGYTNVPQAYCNDQTAASLNNSNNSYSNGGETKTNTTVTYDTTGWSSANNGTCYGTKTTVTTTYNTKTLTQTAWFADWRYEPLSVNLTGLKNGANWRNSFNWRIGNGGVDKAIGWDGCIEERPTVRTTNYNPIPNGTGANKAWDLDIDLTPTSGQSRSLWGPALPDIIYTRGNAFSDWTRDVVNDERDFGNDSLYDCPAQGKLLQSWPDPNIAGQPSFDTYVDSLTPGGNTYHDIGLLWGARFLSPSGPFENKVTLPGGTQSGQNKSTDAGGEIERHMIFMTDGDACTSVRNYQAYGIGWFDRRQTPDDAVPTEGCTSTGTLTEQVNLRTAALCTEIKNKEITLWVVAFGKLAGSTTTRLRACASPGRYFEATNAPELQQTFKAIADQISMLRLTS